MKTNKTTMNGLAAAICVAMTAICLAGCEKEKTGSDGGQGNEGQKTEVSSVEVTPAEVSLKEGETVRLQAKTLPEDAEGTVVWTSGDAGTATVAEDGTVTAIAAGQTEITATCGNASGTCKVTVTAAEEPLADPVAGDWYYSDGTWSTDLDPEREVIGVVFWTGNPADEDMLLAAEHPECVHGLVVSLSGDEASPWQAQISAYGATVWSWVEENTEGFMDGVCHDEYSEDDNLNKKLGYNNTKAAEAFNAGAGNGLWPVDAVAKAAAYGETVPAPETSSGWYLPSAKELSLLCSGEYDGNIYDIYGETATAELVNSRLAMLEGSAQLEGYYWSSTESSSYSYAFEVSFSSGTVGSGSKSGSSDHVRFILAF